MNHMLNVYQGNVCSCLPSFIEAFSSRDRFSHRQPDRHSQKKTTTRKSNPAPIPPQNFPKKIQGTQALFTTTSASPQVMRKPIYQETQTDLKDCFLKTPKSHTPSRVSLSPHKDYLIGRIKETRCAASGSQLFKEIQAKGYRGSFSNVSNFLWAFRRHAVPSQGHLAFHKDYLTKRMEETWPHCVSAPKLFREIRDRGYQGGLRSVQLFTSAVRKNKYPPEGYLAFHRSYMHGRMEKTWPHCVSARKLFGEIRARGYRGALKSVKQEVTVIRREILFKKMQDRGYRGALEVVQSSVKTIGENKHSPQSYLKFHKDYLIERIEKAFPDCIPVSELFQDIQNKGYRGSYETVRSFVSMVRRGKPTSVLCSYQDYLVKRIEAALPYRVSASELLREIQDKGYRGSYKTVQNFVSVFRKNKCVEPTDLSSHKDYLIETLKKALPHRLSAVNLFRDIQARGYLGGRRQVERFVAMAYKDNICQQAV